MITESKYSPNKILKDQALFQDLYNAAIQQNPNSLYTGYFFGKILETMELNDKDRAELDNIREIQQSLDFARVDAEKTNLSATQQQALLAKVQAMAERSRLEGGSQQQPMDAQEVPEDEFLSQTQASPVDLLPSENPELLATE